MGNYNDLLSQANRVQSTANGILIWTIISVILAIVGGILVYFLFVKNKATFSAKLEKLREILDFKKMYIETLLKISYYILTIYVVLGSFSLVSISFVSFLLQLILGPVVIRIIYEASLIGIEIWKNTREIAKNTKK